MEFIEELFLSLKYSTKDMIVLPGENLEGTLKYCIILATCSIVSSLMHWITFKDWRGALLSVILLKIITLKGRRKNHAVSGSNGNDSSGTISNTSREENSNTEDTIEKSENEFGNDF